MSTLPSGAAGRLARAIALPGEYGELRLPTSSIPRTSSVSLKDQVTVNCVDCTSTIPQWSAGSLCAAFFGQPGRLGYISTILNSAVYDMIFSDGQTSTTTWNAVPAQLNSNVTTYSIDAEWPVVAGKLLSGYGTYGTTMSVGMSTSGNYIFMNAGDFLSVLATSFTSSFVGNVTFHIHRYQDAGDPSVAYAYKTIALVNGQIPNATVFTATVAGYYKIKLAEFEISSGGMSSTSNKLAFRLTVPSGVGWRPITMGDLDIAANGDPNLGQSVRASATSLLMTNTTSALNRQGTVLAARLRGEPFYELTPAQLSSKAEKYTGDAAKGCYTFKEFTQYAEQFRSATGTGQYLMYSYDLDFDDYYHFIQITCPGVATSPNTYTVSFDTILEFQTDVARYSKGVSKYRFDDLVEARRILNENPHWFYENPTHMQSLYNFIKSGAQRIGRGVQAIAPYAATAASAIDPVHAPAYAALARLLHGVHI